MTFWYFASEHPGWAILLVSIVLLIADNFITNIARAWILSKGDKNDKP